MLFYVFGSCLRYQFHILNFENEKKPLSLSLQEESFTWKSSASKKQSRTKNSLSFFYILILYFLIFILFLFTFCWSEISWVYVSFVFRWVTVRLNFTWRKRQSRKSISRACERFKTQAVEIDVDLQRMDWRNENEKKCHRMTSHIWYENFWQNNETMPSAPRDMCAPGGSN